MTTPERVLYVAWRSPTSRGIYPVGRLVEGDTTPRYEFAYIKGALEAEQHGFMFLLRAVRYVPLAEPRIEQLSSGDRLICMLDVQNPKDPLAVALRTEHDNVLLGYLPRYLGADLYECFSHKCTVTVFVDRVNMPPAPLQSRVLCRLVVTGAHDFEPFSGPLYQPISKQAALVRHGPARLAS